MDRSRDRDFRDYERSSKRSRDGERRQRSRSKERFERKRRSSRSRSRDRERERGPERDRDRRRSRSPPNRSSNQGQGRDHHYPDQDHHHHAHSSQSSQIRIKQERPDPDEPPPRPRHRERDWDNFFNPNSEMSKKANIKREREEEDRKVSLSEFGPSNDSNEDSEKPKEQPNFGLSGKLTEETNTYRGVVIKYSEPAEARKPNKIRWRLYPFKGEEALPVMYVHRQSAYLLGRERKIADIPVDHPSCSKQHAVLQYRLVPYVRADGSKGRRIRPYIIDLESANGTYVNGNRIEAKRYVELFEKDVLKFGYSSREYVLLHDESKNIEDDYAEMTPD